MTPVGWKQLKPVTLAAAIDFSTFVRNGKPVSPPTMLPADRLALRLVRRV